MLCHVLRYPCIQILKDNHKNIVASCPYPSERDKMKDRMLKLYVKSDRKMPCPPAESSLALTDFVNLSPVAELASNLPT